MIPELWKGDNAHSYTSLGYKVGGLFECTKCEVEEELNGSYTLNMEYPVTGNLASEILPVGLIRCQANCRDTNIQAFRIKNVSVPLKGTMKIQAEHITYDLSRVVVRPFKTTIRNCTAGLMLSILKYHCSVSDETAGIRVYSLYNDTQLDPVNLAYDTPFSLRSVLAGEEGSIIDRFGGEWVHDIKNSTLVKKRGIESNVLLSSGGNIDSVLTTYSDNYYTYLLPYYTYTDSNGDSQCVVGDRTAIYREYYGIPRPTMLDRVKTIDCTGYFGETVPTVDQLNQYAFQYRETHKFDINVSRVVKMTTFKNISENIGIGDTVSIIADKELFSTRVRRVVWDVLNERYKSVTVGDVQETITDVIRKIRR